MGEGSFFLGFFKSDRTLMGPLSPSTYWALECEWYLMVRRARKQAEMVGEMNY